MPVEPAKDENKKVMENIKDGLAYIRDKAVLFKTLVITLIVATFAMNYAVLLPVFTKVVLHEEETGFGFLMSCMGIGSFFGALFIAAISGHGPKKNILLSFPLFIAASLILSGLVSTYFLMAVCLIIMGFFFVSFASIANTTLQINTKNEYRGRVMSIYTLVFSGSTPIGNLFAGIITDHFGPSAAYIACGVMIILPLLALYIWKVNSETA
ncbi:hypothetical protein SDC9_176311 [bioreactor metagenome]|uniref:Major facilitator superfamily (MFS) profile domain-containing protein n=1 Tax=bioreactor metagenome TaxID=1076179 RepID=A0A645GRM3_9ZZZZ